MKFDNIHSHFSTFLIEIADKNLEIAISLSHPAPFFRCWLLAHEDPRHAQLFRVGEKEKGGMEDPSLSLLESESETRFTLTVRAL